MTNSENLSVKSSALSVERSGADGKSVDAANPWLGLESYTESSRAFFFGREKETDELVRLIRRNTLTVLFGQSGLGQSSLLQAGAFPQLRDTDFLPLYVRLDHSSDSPPLAEQVKAALTAAFESAGADAPAFRSDETLWEYFHRKDTDIWSAKNRLLTPVLAFDQFEEIFTLGRASDAQRERGRAFLVELADLVENRAPAALREKFDSGELDITRFNFEKPSCQVVLSLREDFLPDLEGLKNEMRSIMQSRMRVRRLNGTQALEIVQKPAPHLLAEGVAERVVEFVAGARGGSAERLAELEVEPALLSVICRELNERRRTLGQPQISADLVSGNRREILTDFYERSVADLPEAMRTFVEDRLLTKSGFRDNLALETALEFSGVTRPLIDTLVARRLVRLEDRLGVQRVELTHDVLAEVIRAARDTRQQRLALEEAREKEQLTRAAAARAVRRQRWVIAGLATAVAALLVGAFFGLRAQRHAERFAREKAAEASRTDFIFGSRLLDENKTPEGLAYLVRAARSDPTNPTIGPRLVSALASRSFAQPVGRPIGEPNSIFWARYLNERRLLTANNGPKPAITTWDVETGQRLRTFEIGVILGVGGFWAVHFSPDGRLRAVVSADGTVNVEDVESGRHVIGPLRHEQPLLWVVFSPDNRWFLTSSKDEKLRIWNLATGELQGTVPYPSPGFGVIAVSPDSSRFVTVSFTGLRLWRLPDCTPLTDQRALVGKRGLGFGPVEFTSDGKHLVALLNGAAEFCDGMTGEPEGARMPHGGQTLNGGFSHDGTKLATYSSDGTARLWEVPSGKPLGPPLVHGSDVNRAQFTADDATLVTLSGDGIARVWRVATGELALEPIRGGEARAAHVHPTRPEIILSGTDGLLRRWQIAASAARPMEIPADPNRLAFARNARGEPSAWAIYPTRMQKIDLLTGAASGSAIEFPTALRGALLAPNEARLAVRTEADELELWQLEGAKITRRGLGVIQSGGGANINIRFSPDSAFLARGSQASQLTVWDAKTGDTLLGPLENLGLAASRHLSAYSQSSRHLIAQNSSANENTVAIVDLAQRKPGHLIRNGGGPVWAIALSPDERWVALGDSNGVIKIWDIATNELVGAPLVPRRTIIRGASFDRGGGRLLSWNRTEVYLWDVATRKRLLPVMPAGTDVITAIFSPDESRIASFATTRGEVRVFDAATGAQLGEPILGAHSTTFVPISFTADGRFLITQTPPLPGAGNVAVSDTTGLLVWPVPPGSSGQPLPAWLARLASAVAGGEIDRNGVLQDRVAGADVFDEIRAELAAQPKDAPYAEWGRWILADRATRPIGPGLKITAVEAGKLAEKRAAP